MEITTCIECGKEFSFYKSKTHERKFCTNKCQNIFQTRILTEKNIKLLIEGKLSDVARQRIKRTMLAYGIPNRCAICNITDWLGKPLPFVLDHIDGSSNNNKLENLRFLCSNCDSQTETYKGRNKGKGRKSLAKEEQLQQMGS